MAQVLFIKGHPANADKSVSSTLADRFMTAYKKAHPGDTITTVDLYHDDILLIDAKLSRLTELSDQFIAADKYIFAAPMWNMGYPPMVKAYVDGAMIVQGKTFKYTDQGAAALLRGQGKKAMILEVSGGQYLGHANGKSHGRQQLLEKKTGLHRR